jgi:hypothetical protein
VSLLKVTEISEYAPWTFAFTLKTKQREFRLFAPTAEERDLWVAGINRIMNVPVEDPLFKPTAIMSVQDLEAEEVLLTEGNKDSQRRSSFSKPLKLHAVEEETKRQET